MSRMKYYVTIKHPITGDEIQVVPVSQSRTENGRGTELKGTVISPGANMDTIWFNREDLVTEILPF